MFSEKSFSYKFHIIHKKTPVPEPRACNFIKKETPAEMFSCKFYEISKNTFMQNTFGQLLLKIDIWLFENIAALWFSFKIPVNFQSRLEESSFTKFLNSTSVGIIHLVRTQDFPKNQHFLPPDTHM